MGGFNKSESSQRRRSSGQSESFIAPFQVPFFNELFSQTQALAGQQQGQIGGVAQGLSDQLLGQGQQFIGALQGPQAPGVNQQIGALSGFNQNPLFQTLQAQLQQGGPGANVLEGIAAGQGPLGGQEALTDIAGGGQVAGLLQQNPGLQGQLSVLDQAIQENLRSTAGTIAGQATLAGATGGSRQALATGLAGQEAQRQFGQGAQSLISQDFASRQALAPQLQAQQLAAASQLQQGALGQQAQQLQAAQQLQGAQQFQAAGISDLLAQQLQAAQGAGQLGIAQGQLQGAASQAGLGGLGGLLNLGLSPFSAAFSPLLAASEIFGGPTVLQQSSQQSRGRASSSGFGFTIT